MSSEVSIAIQTHQSAFDLDLSEQTIRSLDRYYALLMEHNPILHLIGPMSAEEFAIRHILESLTMLRYLPPGARFADVGSGGGLPAIPCLLAREDLQAVLIESKEKKADFLRTAIAELGLQERADVINKQFSEVTLPPHVTHISCRALDKFTEKLRQLLKWAGGRELFLFGGPKLRDSLGNLGYDVTEELMPLSEQRYLLRPTRRRRNDH